MALKSHRIHNDSTIEHFMSATAERGGIVSLSSTTSSGTAMDQAANTVAYVAEPSGVEPRGILMCTVVDEDLTRVHRNWHKEEVQVGGKVTVWTQGTVTTDRIYPGQTPAAGDAAYVGHSGFIANSDVASDSGPDASADRKVGRFITGKDEDGYAKVQINLP
jgi:hypothetical protein